MIVVINEDIDNVNLSPHDKYNEYLLQHISNVGKVWEDIKPKIIEKNDIDPEIVSKINNLITNHDKSKYSNDEFDAYMNYFYDSNKKDEDEFNIAWNHHQKVNPHHWQYWILLKDSGKQIVLDMPIEYILEMICDWQSFVYKDPESTANKWYSDNKDKMQLSDNTTKILKKYLKYLD